MSRINCDTHNVEFLQFHKSGKLASYMKHDVFVRCLVQSTFSRSFQVPQLILDITLLFHFFLTLLAA